MIFSGNTTGVMKFSYINTLSVIYLLMIVNQRLYCFQIVKNLKVALNVKTVAYNLIRVKSGANLGCNFIHLDRSIPL